MKILHTADLHLQEDSERRWNTFFWICEKARVEKVDYLIISGDIFDSPIQASQEAREKMKKAFERISPIKIIIVPGNHDIKGEVESFAPEMFYGENVFIGSEGPYQIFDSLGQDIVFYCIPFQKGKKARDLLPISEVQKDIKKINIGILHGTLVDEGEIRSFVQEMDIEKDEYFPVETGDVESWGFDYLALGHIHNHFSKRVIGETIAVYPGTPEPMKINEASERKVVLADIKNKGKIEIQDITIETALRIESIGPFMIRIGEVKNVFSQIDQEMGKRIKEGANRKIWPLIRIEGVVEDERALKRYLDYITDKYACRFPEFSIKNEILSIAQFKDFPVCLSFIKKVEERIEQAETDKERNIYKRALSCGLKELREKGGLG